MDFVLEQFAYLKFKHCLKATIKQKNILVCTILDILLEPNPDSKQNKQLNED